MKTLLKRSALVLLLAVPARAREFTQADGSKVDGDITGIANGVVQLKTTQGSTVALPVASLSAADRQYAQQWWEERRKYSLAISSLKKKGSQRSKGRDGSLNTVTQDWLYSVSVRNSTNTPTPPLSIKYDVFVSVPGGAPRAAVTHTINIPALKAGGSHSFDTASVNITSYEAPKGSFFVNGQDRKKRDSLEGMTLRISANGREIWLYENLAGLLTGKTLTFGNTTISVSGGKGSPPYSGPPAGLGSSLLR